MTLNSWADPAREALRAISRTMPLAASKVVRTSLVFSSFHWSVMLSVSSSTTTCTVFCGWKKARAEKPRKRAMRNPASTTSRQRRASRMSCSMISRRRLRFCDLSRNSIAAQRTRRKRIRLIRWMMIGALTSAAPATIV